MSDTRELSAFALLLSHSASDALTQSPPRILFQVVVSPQAFILSLSWLPVPCERADAALSGERQSHGSCRRVVVAPRRYLVARIGNTREAIVSPSLNSYPVTNQTTTGIRCVP